MTQVKLLTSKGQFVYIEEGCIRMLLPTSVIFMKYSVAQLSTGEAGHLSVRTHGRTARM